MAALLKNDQGLKRTDEADVKVVDENTHVEEKAKKPKKPKKPLPTYDVPEQLNDNLRCIKGWPAKEGTNQPFPPTVPVHRIYAKGTFPEGEIMEHPGANNATRMTSEEKRALDRARDCDWDAYRRGAEAHRETRKFVQSFIRPGLTTLEVVQALEAKSKELIAARGLESGYAFPTGISINHCAAHYTPNYGDDPVVLTYDDVVKIDYGIHVGGRLVDCAFTVAFNEKFDPLVQATIEGTNAGLKAAGVDARFSDIGEAIEEVISSFEIELDGKMKAIKPIENLNGHTVDLYKVHGGKSLPIVGCDIDEIMEEGEVYAIETFASTGKGKVWEEGVCSHYMPDFTAFDNPKKYPGKPGAPRKLLHGIRENFSTLAFCRRWLDDLGHTRHLLSLKSLVEDGIINPYPPLCDEKGSFTSQMEHTIMLRPTCKEVVTRGPDY